MQDDPLKRVSDRLQRIDLDGLTDEQAIEFAQAQAALVSVHVQIATHEFLTGYITDRLKLLLYNLDCDYRHKYGNFPEDEKWPSSGTFT
jgi:hypothetical protein